MHHANETEMGSGGIQRILGIIRSDVRHAVVKEVGKNRLFPNGLKHFPMLEKMQPRWTVVVVLVSPPRMWN